MLFSQPEGCVLLLTLVVVKFLSRKLFHFHFILFTASYKISGSALVVAAFAVAFAVMCYHDVYTFLNAVSE